MGDAVGMTLTAGITHFEECELLEYATHVYPTITDHGLVKFYNTQFCAMLNYNNCHTCCDNSPIVIHYAS